MTDPFKVGCHVRIKDPTHPEKDGREGVITTMAINGAIIQFPDGMGTAVKFNHLEHV